MKSVRTGIAGAVLVLIMVGSLSSAAFAYFSTKGAGDATAGVSKLSTLTTVTATPAVGGTVALSWSAVVPPGPGTVTYAVSRNGGAPSGACPSASAQAPVTSCTDSGLDIGTYVYVVTAYWRSWSASSPTATAKITVGQVTHLDLKAAPPAPDGGGHEQPDDHRPGRERQHRHDLHRLPQPHLLGRLGQPPPDRPHRDAQRRTGA